MKKKLFTFIMCLATLPAVAQLNCTGLSATVTTSINGNTVLFSNNATPSNQPPVVENSYWNFGDGNGSLATSPSHTYAANGTYNVQLIHEWYDTLYSIVCHDTVNLSVTVPGGGGPTTNRISGNIYWDTTGTAIQASFTVWLIVHDNVNNTLTAVDSTVTGGFLSAPYQFDNHAAGDYLVKAAQNAGGMVSAVFLPTYHDSSIYWGGATTINHTGGGSYNNHIYMISGTPTSGPGFIGGNISQGANKGTANGIPGILVFVRDVNGKALKFTVTDQNGDYSFSDLPLGTYSVYPEAINYVTTPSLGLTVTSGQPSVIDIDFGQTATEIKPKVTSIGEVGFSSGFQVFPNPAKGAVSVSWSADLKGTAEVKLMDLTGRVIQTAQGSVASDLKLDISNCSEGTYLIQILTEKGQYSERLMIQ